MLRVFTILGALSGFIAVCAGAFGAHALRQRVTPDLLDVFETAARYEMYHALALLAVAWKVQNSPDSPALRLSGWCFFAGIVIFCGSLYLLVLTDSTWLGAVTPFGGIAFLAGWLGLGWEAMKAKA